MTATATVTTDDAGCGRGDDTAVREIASWAERQ